MPLIRQKYLDCGLSLDVVEFLLKAWRTGTRRQYESYLKKWLYNCKIADIDPLHPCLDDVMKYMLQGFRSGLCYSTLGTMRSALSAIISIDNVAVGQHPVMVSFMRAAFHERPALQKTMTWEINDMLIYLKTLSPICDITLQQLTQKTIMLMALLSGQRGQTLHALQADTMKKSERFITFYITKPLKTSKPGKHLSELCFKTYELDQDLCVVTCIYEYLHRTEKFRVKGVTQFFLTYGKPNGEAARSSISRWIRDVLHDAGIDVEHFSSHSTRSASTSAARSVVNLDTILKAGGWACASTFTRYYSLAITPRCEMQDALLHRFENRN